MSAVITPFEGTELFNTASFNNRISQINTGFSYVSNPNLLDNWYFGNPVNQRGQTEYTGNNIYIIDRFINYSLNVNISNLSLKLSSAQNWYSRISQKIEPQILNALSGKQVTMTALFKSAKAGQVKLSLFDSDDNTSSTTEKIEAATGDVQLVTATVTVPSSYANHKVEALFYPDLTMVGQETELYALKLELGPTQTLAHQENGVWVLNEVPDYGEQLRRCQRYAIDGKYYTTVGKLNYDGNVYYISVQFPFAMRTLPAITLKEISAIGWGTLPISSAELSWVDANGFFVAIKDLSNMDNFIGRSCVVTYFATADL